MSPAAAAELQRGVAARLAEIQLQAGCSSDASRYRLKAVEANIARLVDAIASVNISQALQQRLAAAETEQAALRPLLQNMAVPTYARVTDNVT